MESKRLLKKKKNSFFLSLYNTECINGGGCARNGNCSNGYTECDEDEEYNDEEDEEYEDEEGYDYDYNE